MPRRKPVRETRNRHALPPADHHAIVAQLLARHDWSVAGRCIRRWKLHAEIEGRAFVGSIDRHQPLAGREDRVELRGVGMEFQAVLRTAVVSDVELESLAQFDRRGQRNAQLPVGDSEFEDLAAQRHRIDGQAAYVEFKLRQCRPRHRQLDRLASPQGAGGYVRDQVRGVANHVESARCRRDRMNRVDAQQHREGSYSRQQPVSSFVHGQGYRPGHDPVMLA